MLTSSLLKVRTPKGLLEINAGDTILIKGPNGSGKSTIVENIIGVGKKANFWKLAKIAYVPQNSIYTNVPVGELLDTFAKIKKAFPQAKANVIKAFCLENLLDLPLYTISSGEQKRVMLAIGLLFKPQIIVLDEFFQSLDKQVITDYVALFNNLKATYPDLAFVVVSHQEEFKPSFFTKVVELASIQGVVND